MLDANASTRNVRPPLARFYSERGGACRIEGVSPHRGRHERRPSAGWLEGTAPTTVRSAPFSATPKCGPSFCSPTRTTRPPAARPPAAGRSHFPPRGTVNPGPPGDVFGDCFPGIRYEMISFSRQHLGWLSLFQPPAARPAPPHPLPPPARSPRPRPVDIWGPRNPEIGQDFLEILDLAL